MMFYDDISMASEKDLVLNNLLALLEKWKRSIDRGKVFGAILTDHSKAFDCLNHNKKQRTRINNSYST